MDRRPSALNSRAHAKRNGRIKFESNITRKSNKTYKTVSDQNSDPTTYLLFYASQLDLRIRLNNNNNNYVSIKRCVFRSVAVRLLLFRVGLENIFLFEKSFTHGGVSFCSNYYVENGTRACVVSWQWTLSNRYYRITR